MKSSVLALALALGAAGAFAQPTFAQQKVEWDSKMNIPVAPKGLKARPLPDHPLVFDTAEGQNIRLVVLARGLEFPWSMAFLPDGKLAVAGGRPGQEGDVCIYDLAGPTVSKSAGVAILDGVNDPKVLIKRLLDTGISLQQIRLYMTAAGRLRRFSPAPQSRRCFFAR